ncbi:MAG: hypothetical protein AAFR60_00245 [Pseudomonadota bacterium]
MSKDSDDYWRGRSGQWWVGGLGQLGYADHEAERRKRAAASPAQTSGTPGGLVLCVVVLIFIAAVAQALGVDLHTVAARQGYLTRYTDVSPVAVAVIAGVAALVVGRAPRLFDQLAVITAAGLIAATYAGLIELTWADAAVWLG